MTYKFESAFNINDIVSHVVSGDRGMITNISYDAYSRRVVYEVCLGIDDCVWCKEIELSTTLV